MNEPFNLICNRCGHGTMTANEIHFEFDSRWGYRMTCTTCGYDQDLVTMVIDQLKSKIAGVNISQSGKCIDISSVDPVVSLSRLYFNRVKRQITITCDRDMAEELVKILDELDIIGNFFDEPIVNLLGQPRKYFCPVCGDVPQGHTEKNVKCNGHYYVDPYQFFVRGLKTAGYFLGDTDPGQWNVQIRRWLRPEKPQGLLSFMFLGAKEKNILVGHFSYSNYHGRHIFLLSSGEDLEQYQILRERLTQLFRPGTIEIVYRIGDS